MSSANNDKSNTETLEYLIGIVIENREKRCAEIREAVRLHSSEIIRQAHTRVRERMHHHILILREKYRERVSAAQARNQTLIRQHRQLADKECLATAWPLLAEALKVLWTDPVSKQNWLAAAIKQASFTFLQHDWCIEHPVAFSDEDKKSLQQALADNNMKAAELRVNDDIEAGIRIVVDGTVIDATLHGLLQQRRKIEAMLISRIKQDVASDD
jgi:hypothetical protein